MIRMLLISLFILSACSPSNPLDYKNVVNDTNRETENTIITTPIRSNKITNDNITQTQLKTDNGCSINFPKTEEHFTKAPCLTLPVKMSDFENYPKLTNGYIDLEKLSLPIDDNDFIHSGNYERTRILGIIPYDDTKVFLLLISNLDMEGDGFGQAYDLKLYNRDDGSDANGGGTYIGSYSLFYEEPLDYLYDTTQPFKFKDIAHLQATGYCMQNFELLNHWEIIQHNTCKKFSDTKNYLESNENLILNTEEMYFEQASNNN